MNRELSNRLPLSVKLDDAKDFPQPRGILIGADGMPIAFTKQGKFSCELLRDSIALFGSSPEYATMQAIAHCVNNYQGLVDALQRIYEISDIGSGIAEVARDALRGAGEE